MASFEVTAGILMLLLVDFHAILSPCQGASIKPVQRRATGCTPGEKAALLQFKEGIVDDSSGKLSSWASNSSSSGAGGGDCCTWPGVGCDSISGEVTKLNLSCDGDQLTCLNGTISPSLFSLKHLKYLDLSRSEFGAVPIPEFFGVSLTELTHLNLSSCDFTGPVPHRLGNLSSLRVLDLSYGYSLQLDSADWLGGLTSLEELYLGHVSAAAATTLFRVVINKIPRVSILSLPSCELGSAHITATLVGRDDAANSFTSPPPLTKLDLSTNLIDDSTALSWLSNVSTLQYLDLSFNDVQRGGTVDEGETSIAFFTQNHCELRYLDLSDTGYLAAQLLSRKEQPFSPCVNSSLETLTVSGNVVDQDFPRWVGEFKNLKHLALRYTSLRGQIPEFFGSSGGMLLLQKLYIDHNKLTGPIPDSIGNLTLLEKLYLDSNELSGPIPSSIGNLVLCVDMSLGMNQLNGSIPSSLSRLSSLQTLDLSNNNLSGNVPESLGGLSNLQSLKISYNSLSGAVTEKHFSNLTQLQWLHLSFNHLSMKLPDSWVPPFSLRDLLLVSCTVGPRFPGWIRTQVGLEYLSLLNSNISDILPPWIWSFSTSLYHIDISSNDITGTVPPILQDLLRVTLGFINFGSNRLTGALPQGFQNLGTLFLQDNSFSGEIPLSYCDTVQSLQALDLSINNLSGTIPACFKNASSVTFINLSFNNFTGGIQNLFGDMLAASCAAMEIRLSNNHFSGPIPSSLQKCSELIVLDLSNNNFTGTLPDWTADKLIALKALRLRSNSFSGEIPSGLSRLENLTIVDLAHNRFMGSVPRSFGNFAGMKRKHNISDSFSYENYPNVNELLEMISTLYVNTQGTPIVVVSNGRFMRYGVQLQLVTICDLSDNRLSGDIPKELGDLRTLLAMNLSGNHLTGQIPEEIGKMTSLLSLDLSRNSLHGDIPRSMLALTSLSALNLSYNNLSGEIPTGTQFATFTNLSFVGNPMLCGFPLQACRKEPLLTKEADDARHDGKNHGGLINLSEASIGIAIGFVIGLWAVWGTLLLNVGWRRNYFFALDKVFVEMYPAISRSSI